MGKSMKKPHESTWSDEGRTFLSGDNALYAARMYAQSLEDPSSVDQSWVDYFSTMSDEEHAVMKDLLGPSWNQRSYPFHSGTESAVKSASVASPSPSDQTTRQAILDSIRAIMLIRAYRACGHLVADLDPLGLANKDRLADLDPKSYGFTEQDMDRPIFIDNFLGHETLTLRKIIAILKRNYCGQIGIEFLHIQDSEKKQWLQRQMEGGHDTPGIGAPLTDKTLKTHVFEDLAAAETFEQFLHVKYPAAKRFGLDGGESLIPGLEQALATSANMGIKDVVIGMAHRGRLNVLANIMGKPYRAIFSEFQGASANPEDVQGSGDVKYHLGTSTDRIFGENKVHLSLTANPSHLEAVDPVVVGKVRAKQDQLGDTERKQVMGLLLHGDAAFAGQGLVAETLCMSELLGYNTGGTFHIIINNQIGFTTSPEYSRSTAHSSDLAKTVQAPIFHVNADYPEAVAKVMKVAAEYRQLFNSDVVVDLICYRRFGHNEADEPKFTQPIMYNRISQHPTIKSIYTDRLLAEGSFSQDELNAIQHTIQTRLQKEFDLSQDFKPERPDWLEGRWKGFQSKYEMGPHADTGISEKDLKKIGKSLTKIPEDFNLNPKLKRFLSGREEMLQTGQHFDWSMGEALAFASLVDEGVRVRLSGQDSGRGTFTQRHAIFKDQATGEGYISLNHISKKQGRFEVWDSPLAEASVLGFEMGYSLAEPEALVLWEAQFGDFANGAQVIVDQFVSSGESKWLRMSGLVMLLPHGYEGQGPEHSSARLERYLQLCAEDNMQVINATTPANYFHALRRQIHRPYRKPLVVMTPKSLLRNKRAVSTLTDFTNGTHFLEVIPETEKLQKAKDISRVVLCSGKVYYDLIEKREEEGIKDIAIIRLEQFYPFPDAQLEKELKCYPNAEVVWCQEEPKNMGAWTFLDRRIESVLQRTKNKNLRPQYIGRMEAASTATGLNSRHVFEQNLLVSQALKLI